jgi:4-hydroxybenzoate polyprenyltransferase/phosphoserine phosphatase
LSRIRLYRRERLPKSILMNYARQLDLSKPKAICVDLDGTLLKSDFLWEAVFWLLKNKPLIVLKLPFWFLKGVAYLKEKIAENVDLDIETLPWNSDVLRLVLDLQKAGLEAVLVTGSHKIFAEKVANHFKFFNRVFATEGSLNLVGYEKLKKLKYEFGPLGFSYIGDSKKDIPILESSAHAYVVDSKIVFEKVSQFNNQTTFLPLRKKGVFKELIKSLRPHQWSKNILIFLGPLAGHILFQPSVLVSSLILFVCFSMVASSVYLVNDLIDLESDRKHQTKKMRPMASGFVPISYAVTLSMCLFLVGIVISWNMIGAKLAFVLMSYFISTLAYSVWIKQIAIADVIMLAFFYIVRVVAGCVAVNIVPSFWLINFILFSFLSLGFAKRVTELISSAKKLMGLNKHRAYRLDDLDALLHFGTASGYLSLLVLSLYLKSPEVVRLYSRPNLLWGLVLISLYWISEIWISAGRGSLHDDPVIHVLKSKKSYFLIVVAIGFFLFAL